MQNNVKSDQTEGDSKDKKDEEEDMSLDQVSHCVSGVLLDINLKNNKQDWQLI